MTILPILTEKSLMLARNGVYTFRVQKQYTKYQIKQMIADMFSVHPTDVATMNYKPTTRRTNRGKYVTTKAFKKALVSLKKGETIALFNPKKADK